MDSIEQIPASSRSRFNQALIGAVIVVAIFVAGLLILYFTHFSEGLSEKQGDWGAFGDYIGGLLNPVLGFITVIALLYTIRIQVDQLRQTREELDLSRRELELTRQELKRTADTQQAQLASIQREESKEDVYRIINFLFSDITNSEMARELPIQNLNKHVPLGDGSYKIQLLRVGDVVGPDKLSDQYLHRTFSLFELQDGEEQSEPRAQIPPLLSPLHDKLKELANFLEAFDELDQSGTLITDFYRRRVSPIAQDLTLAGILSPPEYKRFHAKNRELAWD